MIRSLLILLVAGCLASLSAEPRQRLVVLGDSIAAGFGLDTEEAYPALLQKEIDDAGLPYQVVNAGVSGDTTAGGLRRLSWILRQPVEVLLIELGGNDGLRGISPEETEKNLEQIVAKARERYPRVKIVIAGMQMPANMGAEYREKYRQLFGAVAKRTGSTLIPFLLEGVAARPDLNQPDRIHPTAAGQKIVADNVWKVLKPVLVSADPRQ
jgi:acyl-CoA thioesterase-1